jgi:hypothetical protein
VGKKMNTPEGLGLDNLLERAIFAEVGLMSYKI